MTIQAINTVQNNARLNKPSFTSEPKTQEEKSNGKALLLGSLVALAIGGGIYLATRGKSKGSSTSSAASQTVSNTEASPVKALEEKITKLKQDIRGRFVEARDSYWGNRDNLGGSPLFITNDLGLINYAHSIKQADEVLTRLLKAKDVADAKKVLAEFSQSVRSKLAELSTDADWVEMRKLRKQLIKDDLNKNYNGERLSLINEILYAKVNGKSKFLDIIGLSVDDAIRMVKAQEFPKDTYSNLIRRASNVGTMDANFKRIMRDENQMVSPLTKMHFGDFNNIDIARFTIRENQRQIKHTLEWQEKFHERLEVFHNTVLADFRQSDKVKQLKQLVEQLKQSRSEK